MSGQKNLCVKILEKLQNNEHRQSVLHTRAIIERPLTVVVLSFESCKYRIVASGEARCNGEDRFSSPEGFAIASKRAMRKLASDKQAREELVKFRHLLKAWS